MEDGNHIVKQVNGEYGGKVNQRKIVYYGSGYFEKVCPRLSVIKGMLTSCDTIDG
jgi:hypothetical protein